MILSPLYNQLLIENSAVFVFAGKRYVTDSSQFSHFGF